jgi:hypothetical protein
MKKLITLVLISAMSMSVLAEAEVKEVCKDRKDSKGAVVKDKSGKARQECKKIRVHKKLEGTPVPEKK